MHNKVLILQVVMDNMEQKIVQVQDLTIEEKIKLANEKQWFEISIGYAEWEFLRRFPELAKDGYEEFYLTDRSSFYWRADWLSAIDKFYARGWTGLIVTETYAGHYVIIGKRGSKQ